MFALPELQGTACPQEQGKESEATVTPTHYVCQQTVFAANLQRPAGKMLAGYYVRQKHQQWLILLIAVNFLILYYIFFSLDMLSSSYSYT